MFCVMNPTILHSALYNLGYDGKWTDELNPGTGYDGVEEGRNNFALK